jgi:hypothetical protein
MPYDAAEEQEPEMGISMAEKRRRTRTFMQLSENEYKVAREIVDALPKWDDDAKATAEGNQEYYEELMVDHVAELLRRYYLPAAIKVIPMSHQEAMFRAGGECAD